MNYSEIAEWVFRHPIRTDVIVVAAVTGSIAYVLNRQRIRRRKLHRLIRGMLMKPRDTRTYQRMQFEDALMDAALTMLSRGEMTDKQFEWWRQEVFIKQLKLQDFIPKKNVKRGIRARLKELYGLNPWRNVAGGPPTITTDVTYKPTEKPTKLNSRYSEAAE